MGCCEAMWTQGPSERWFLEPAVPNHKKGVQNWDDEEGKGTGERGEKKTFVGGTGTIHRTISHPDLDVQHEFELK